MLYEKKKFTINASKSTHRGHCVKLVSTCINYCVKCDICVKIQGEYTEYLGDKNEKET